MITDKEPDVRIPLRIQTQPDDVTCGPTSLHAVYRHFGLDLDLHRVIDSVDFLEDGGTLAVFLGLDALRRGFDATLITYNLRMFDPTWEHLSPEMLIEKLKAQLTYKKGKKFTEATHAYLRFLESGGQIRFDILNRSLLVHHLSEGSPILTGLSATFLYRSSREYTNHRNQSVYDDLKGEPMGHFVVVYGVEGRHAYVADPYRENPISHDNYYRVRLGRLINAIMLGIITYDSNLLILRRRRPYEEDHRHQ
ncbi:MAG: C39 family peptidase [Bacteroidia bacterium]